MREYIADVEIKDKITKNNNKSSSVKIKVVSHKKNSKKKKL
jgi:hypothetical protein